METLHKIIAYPIRVIPFDMGRELTTNDIDEMKQVVMTRETKNKIISHRQKAIFRSQVFAVSLHPQVDLYAYKTGIGVVVIYDQCISYSKDVEYFSIPYGTKRKEAHKQIMQWSHKYSKIIREAINTCRQIVKTNTKSLKKLRISADETFQNGGLSYVMTLSMFKIDAANFGMSYEQYPNWLKKNIFALLNPAALYLEDSNSFSSQLDHKVDVKAVLNSIEPESNLVDYERHRHIATYMSWAAVIVVGSITEYDMEEYVALEVQLQSDWYYIYCLDKMTSISEQITQRRIIDLQRLEYEVGILEDRIFEFDDPSIPSRVMDIQDGLVASSGLLEQIKVLQKKLKFIIEREKLEDNIRQNKLAQSSELLLFVIAFIEVAPTVMEYGNRFAPYVGVAVNVMIGLLGIILMIWKNR